MSLGYCGRRTEAAAEKSPGASLSCEFVHRNAIQLFHLGLRHSALRDLDPLRGRRNGIGHVERQVLKGAMRTTVEITDLNQLLTYEQLAQFLQMSPGTLRNWVSQQFIPHIKVGGLVRFDRRAIEDWLRKRARPGRRQLRADL